MSKSSNGKVTRRSNERSRTYKTTGSKATIPIAREIRKGRTAIVTVVSGLKAIYLAGKRAISEDVRISEIAVLLQTSYRNNCNYS